MRGKLGSGRSVGQAPKAENNHRGRRRRVGWHPERTEGQRPAEIPRYARDDTHSTATFPALTNEITAIVDNTTVTAENTIGAPKRKNQPTISSPMHASCNVTANGRALRGSRRLSVPSCHARTVMSNISTLIVIAMQR